MPDQPLFKQTQYAFAAHIRNPELNPRPADVEQRRMDIYAELFFNNVEDFLANTYPVVKEIMGEDGWLEMMRDYFTRHKSHTPLFPEMPREFLKYLETERNNPADPPFLKELAHYEWVELALMTSDSDQDINWDQIDKEAELLNNKPVMSPLAWPLTYQYPVQNIGPDFQPQEAAQQPSYILVYRDNEDKVHFMELNPVTALLVQLINEDNNLTTQQMLDVVAEQLQHPEPEVVVNGGMQIIQDLKQRNIILGVRKA